MGMVRSSKTSDNALYGRICYTVRIGKYSDESIEWPVWVWAWAWERGAWGAGAAANNG